MRPEIALLNVLPIGRSSAATGRDLAQQLQQNGVIPQDTKDAPRVVRELVHNLRCLGVPVCADSTDGFYLPANADELRDYVQRLAHRLSQIALPYRALKDTLLHWKAAEGGQTSSQPESEPLPNIPDEFRIVLLKRYTKEQQSQQQSPQQPPQQENPPTIRPNEVRKVNIVEIIDTLMSRAPITPTSTLSETAAWVQMQLVQILRREPYCIYIPLSYLKREGWGRGEIAEYIKERFEQKRSVAASQLGVLGGEEHA